MAGASRKERTGSARSTRSSKDSNGSRAADNALSRDARAFGSMDLHDTISDHSLSATSGDVDDADAADHTRSDSAPHGSDLTLTSLSNLGAEHARRGQRFRGSAGGGGSTVSENDATRILQRIFSMSSRPSQSPPVLDIADAAKDCRPAVPGLGSPETPSFAQLRPRGRRAPADQTFTSSMRAMSMSSADRYSYVELGRQPQPSLSSLSLMPPASSPACGHQCSGRNFLLPSSPIACPTGQQQPSPPVSSYMPLPLHSRASSRCRAPTPGSDADISSSLDSSPDSCQLRDYTPFPVHADTPSPDAPSMPLSADIGTSTSLSSLTDGDLSTANTLSDQAPSAAPLSDASVANVAQGCSNRTDPDATADSAQIRTEAQPRAVTSPRSYNSGTCASACSSPTGDVSKGITPAELFRTQRDDPNAQEAVHSGAASMAATGTGSPDAKRLRSSVAGQRLPFRKHVAVGMVSLLPDLSTVSTVLLAASGVMGLAYSSAMVHTLIREQRETFPRAPAMSGLLLAAELFFLFSSMLQWWLIAGAGTVLKHLTRAAQPSLWVPLMCLPPKCAPRLVFTVAHRATRLALAGQAVGSLVLTVAVTHIMLSEQALRLTDAVLLAARLLVAACNAAFLWEAAYARRRHALTRCPLGGTSAALDSELYLLVSCLLLLAWQVLHTWVSAGSVEFLTVLVSLHCGGASLLRAFGATLLIWGTGNRLSDSLEASKVHAQLKAWCLHRLPAAGRGSGATRESALARDSAPASFAAEYIAAAVTVATNLVAPCALSRAMALQAISGCRACLTPILRPHTPAADEEVVCELKQALHLLLEAATVVRNHNQHRCDSIVFVRGPTVRPSLVTLKVAPAHVRCLYRRHRIEAAPARHVHLLVSDALPMILNLGSHMSEAGAFASARASGLRPDASDRALHLIRDPVSRDSTAGQTQQDDGSSVIVSCEMRSAPQRAQEDSSAHSMGLSAACLSSQLRGRSPSAQLNLHQQPCSSLRPSNGRARQAGCADAASGGVEQHVLDMHLHPTSNGLQPNRLAVFSAHSSFKAATALQHSDESAIQVECAADHSSGNSTATHAPHDLTAAYAVTTCMPSMHAKAAAVRQVAAGGAGAAWVSVKHVQLTTDDVAEICRSIEPCRHVDTSGAADTVVHVHVVPSASAAAAAHGKGTMAPASHAAEVEAAPQKHSEWVTPAHPRALKRLMDAMTANFQIADAAPDPCDEVKESHDPGETADLAAKTFDGPAMRASMLHHIYSASPEAARVGGSSNLEIQHASVMSSPAMVRGHALSAAISQAVSAERAADHTAALPASPQSDTVSIRSHSMPAWESPERVPQGQASQSIADSAWMHVGTMRKAGNSSSGLVHGDSSGAWVHQNRKPPGRGNAAQSLGALQGSQGLSTDGSGQSMGEPSRSYLRQDPRHQYHTAGLMQHRGASQSRRKWESPTREEEAKGVQSIQQGGVKDSESTDLQAAEGGGSMMLPLPPVMSMFL